MTGTAPSVERQTTTTDEGSYLMLTDWTGWGGVPTRDARSASRLESAFVPRPWGRQSAETTLGRWYLK